MERSANVIVDNGATTIYISEGVAEKLGVPIQRVKPRTVSVADKEVVTVSGVMQFELKLGDLPTETICAYTFPLSKVDVVLGLPWLQK